MDRNRRDKINRIVLYWTGHNLCQEDNHFWKCSFHSKRTSCSCFPDIHTSQHTRQIRKPAGQKQQKKADRLTLTLPIMPPASCTGAHRVRDIWRKQTFCHASWPIKLGNILWQTLHRNRQWHKENSKKYTYSTGHNAAQIECTTPCVMHGSLGSWRLSVISCRSLHWSCRTPTSTSDLKNQSLNRPLYFPDTAKFSMQKHIRL